MNKYLLIICICILNIGCKKKSQPSEQTIIATINNITISEIKVDSIISEQVYQLRKNALKTLLRDNAIEIQAHKLHLTKEKFLKNEIIQNNDVSAAQYIGYIRDQGINTKNIDTTKIIEYLTSINKQKHIEHFADSLLAESNTKIYLKPNNFKEVTIENLDYHELSKGKKSIVYIISDFNCPSCQNVEKRLTNIIKKYRSFVSFRFMFFSEYIDRKALAAEAAANQDKFVEMHDFLFGHSTINGDNQSISEFAKKIGLDMKMFEDDILNPTTLKNLIINKEKIIKQNIYVTPSFIINNKLINDEFALYTLENLINEELEKGK